MTLPLLQVGMSNGILQDNPLVLEDDDEKPGEAGAFIETTSVELETETAPLLSSHSREDPKTVDFLDAPIVPESPTELLDRPITPNLALIQHPHKRYVHKDNYGAVAVPPLSLHRSLSKPQSHDNPASDEKRIDEWEITKIVGRRHTRKGIEYEMDWRKTWKPASELKNAQRLI